MNNRYVLTLAAIEARLYTDEADSVFMRWPTAEKELPSGNHTPGGLSETCLHFMEDIMTKTGRPNHRWDNYLYLHFGGWDLLMDYVKRDGLCQKRSQEARLPAPLRRKGVFCVRGQALF